MRYAICYVSTVSASAHTSEIKEVLDFSENKNNRLGLTGVLLFSKGNFFQVLEGEKNVVCDLFRTIQKDSRHYNVIKIFEEKIHKEVYDGYKAGFISENRKYEPNIIDKYLQHVQMLDHNKQNVVKEILNAFIDAY